jgi:hypothetical protein
VITWKAAKAGSKTASPRKWIWPYDAAPNPAISAESDRIRSSQAEGDPNTNRATYAVITKACPSKRGFDELK